MRIYWFQNVNSSIEAANIAADNGVSAVVFRCCHPTDKRHIPALDLAVKFQARNPGIEVIVQQDLWSPKETRLDILANPKIFLDNLAYPRIQMPELSTAIDCEPYLQPLKGVALTRIPVPLDDLIVMKAAVRKVAPFDYVTPATVYPLLYSNQPYSSLAEIFPGLGVRGMAQQFHYKTITNPAKWLGADRSNIVCLAVIPDGDARRYSPAQATKVYPDRDRMLVPEADPIECARQL